MENYSCRSLAEAMGISKSLAAEILALPKAPDAAKFTTPATYFRKLARAAMRAGHEDPALSRWALGGKPLRVDSKAPEVSTVPAPQKEAARAAPEPSEPPGVADVTAADLGSAAATLRDLVVGMGADLAQAVRSKNYGEVVGLLNQFRALSQEFRQTVERLEELRRQRLEHLPRTEVYAAAGQMFQVMRAFGDAIMGDLLSAGNMPAWIAANGGRFPESLDAVVAIRGTMREWAVAHFNRLADTLQDCAVPVDDVSPEVSEECMVEMAAELDRAAADLRARAVKR